MCVVTSLQDEASVRVKSRRRTTQQCRLKFGVAEETDSRQGRVNFQGCSAPRCLYSCQVSKPADSFACIQYGYQLRIICDFCVESYNPGASTVPLQISIQRLSVKTDSYWHSCEKQEFHVSSFRLPLPSLYTLSCSYPCYSVTVSSQHGLMQACIINSTLGQLYT